MAFAIAKFISLFMIIAVSGLISAEEETPLVDATTAENRQSKQLYYVPPLPPASSYPFKYFSNIQEFDFPLIMPKQTPLIRRNPIQQQQLAATSWPYNYPLLSPSSELVKADHEEDETSASWRIHDGYDDYNGMKWWRKGLNREATITIHPADTECLNANMATEGLGPCKRASQANQGNIDMKFGVGGQTAVVAITAHSPKNTRVKLICTDVNAAVGAFTQTGRITTVADTPRTEMGYMYLVVTSTGAATMKCFWLTYRHYTATYP